MKTKRTIKTKVIKKSLGTKDISKNPGLYRAKLSCTIGRNALDGISKLPKFITPVEYAIYNLLHAIEEIADALAENKIDVKEIRKDSDAVLKKLTQEYFL